VYVPVLSEEGIRPLFGNTVFRLLGIAIPLPFESPQLTLVQVISTVFSQPFFSGAINQPFLIIFSWIA
jgi:hypothetical protein